MALRHWRGPGRRRAPDRRALFIAGAVALYLAAALLATWPALRHGGSQFFAEGGPAYGEAAPGDHLQTGWNLWLFGDQLGRLQAPWQDPYSFQPEVAPRVDFQGLVFGLPYWPLAALFGSVLAWNLFTLLTIVLSGVFTCAWLRALRLPPLAALAGGLAFALAPYRIAQSTGHLLGPISIFLPLALWGVEREAYVVTWIALVAIPLSGQVHLALGALPLVVLYAIVRRRWYVPVPGTVAALCAALAVHHFAIAGSLHEGGRSLAEVDKYSATLGGLVSRHARGETFVFLGWLVPLVAVAGFALLVAERRWSLAALLFGAVVVPVVLALGTNLPTYSVARHVVPELKVSRVPERMLPIACLALAALLAFAVAWMRPWLATVFLVLIAADLRWQVAPIHATVATRNDAVFAALRDAAPGRVLDLPVFLPDQHFNSTYLYDDMVARREHPLGYSTTAPAEADATARKLRALNCGGWTQSLVDELGIRYVTVHGGYYERFLKRCERPVVDGLQKRGWKPLAADGRVTVWLAP